MSINEAVERLTLHDVNESCSDGPYWIHGHVTGRPRLKKSRFDSHKHELDKSTVIDWLIAAWPHLRELVSAAEDTALIPCWVQDPNTDLATRLIDKVFAALHRPELAALKEPTNDPA